MDKCQICKSRDWELTLDLKAFFIKDFELALNQRIKVCNLCLSVFIKNLVTQIKINDGLNKNKDKIISSAGFNQRYELERFTKDEMIDVLIKIKNIKNINDFKDNL